MGDGVVKDHAYITIKHKIVAFNTTDPKTTDSGYFYVAYIGCLKLACSTG
jgi:hypothetical protein